MPSEEDKRTSGPLPGDLREAAERGDAAYLLEALSAPDFKVREAAALGLGEIGGDKAELALVRLARDRWNERPEVRIAALRALGRVQKPSRYLATLTQFIAGDNRKVLGAARKMLKAADPEGFPGRLASSGAVDYGAIRVYGAAAEKSAVPLLSRFLLDRADPASLASTVQWGKVHAAVKALGNIGGDDSVKTLGSLAPLLAEAERQAGGLARERIKKLLAAVESSLVRLKKV